MLVNREVAINCTVQHQQGTAGKSEMKEGVPVNGRKKTKQPRMEAQVIYFYYFYYFLLFYFSLFFPLWRNWRTGHKGRWIKRVKKASRSALGSRNQYVAGVVQDALSSAKEHTAAGVPASSKSAHPNPTRGSPIDGRVADKGHRWRAGRQPGRQLGRVCWAGGDWGLAQRNPRKEQAERPVAARTRSDWL